MFKKPLVWLGVFALIGLAALWDFSPEDLMRDPPEPEEAFPQAYMIQSETRRFNTEGQLHHQLLSERANHFQPSPQGASAQDYSEIQKPDITVYDQSEDEADARADGNGIANETGNEEQRPAPWRLTADWGHSNAGADRIRLWDNVRAWQETDDGLTELTTPELFIEPARQFAETDKAVKMRSPEGRHQAVGMRADLEKDYIELLSEVRGTYEPQNREP